MSKIEVVFQKGIFIIHALQGYEAHEARIQKVFQKQKLNYQLITKGDPSLFTPEIIDHYFASNIQEKLSTGVLSCTLNHIFAYEEFVNNDFDYAIVFENDPYFLGEFKNNLNQLEAEILQLEPGFIISLENSTLRFPSFWQTKKGRHLYQASQGRMAGAYLMDKQAARNILNDLLIHKCHDVIDWWHNDLIKRKVVKMYWAHPAFVEQGSHNGKLNAGISSKPKSKIRQFKWFLQKTFKYYISRLFKSKFILE